MALSSDLISQFVKITKDSTDVKKETTVYGTTVSYNNAIYVKLDGSDLLTPIETTADVKADERVIVMIKDHTAMVTGNISSPSASSNDLKDVSNKVDAAGAKITEFQTVIADKVSTDQLEAEIGRIDTLVSENVIIKDKLTANEADIDDLQADNVTISGKLTANEAAIANLQTDKLDASIADITFATIEDLNATNITVTNLEGAYGDFKVLTTDRLTANEADIDDLQANKLSATDANLKYANIDFSNIGKAAIEEFYSKSGLIDDLVVGDGTITGTLVGVTIKGDLIEGGTVVADKLVVKGEDGLYYKLNTDGVTTEAEQTDYNSLNGSVITAKSITATKISVNDLVAFDATIGGFKITDDAIYSGVKSSVNNTTRGIYQDNDGQFAIGDGFNYLKYYQDTDGSYKLEISAKSIKFTASNKDLETVIEEVKNTADDAINSEVGGKNLLRGSNITELASDQSWEDGHFKVGSGGDGVGSIVSITDTPIPGINNAVQILENTTGNRDIAQNVTPVLANKEYTFSVWVKGTGTLLVRVGMNLDTGWAADKTIFRDNIAYTSWTRFVKTFTTGSTIAERTMQFGITGACNEMLFIGPKLEIGNKATDWTPAPEDVDSSISSLEDNFEGRLDEVNASIESAQSSIDQLTNMISNLVTDDNGGSLMTQTTDGWTFNMSSITDNLTAIKDAMADMETDQNESYSKLDALTNLVDEIANKTAYITMSTDDNGDPCIELGKTDSLFKVRITNTAIDFLEGSSILAYASNKTFYTDTLIVKNELQIGEGPGFVWRTRENGNMGLVYISQGG